MCISISGIKVAVFVERFLNALNRTENNLGEELEQ